MQVTFISVKDDSDTLKIRISEANTKCLEGQEICNFSPFWQLVDNKYLQPEQCRNICDSFPCDTQRLNDVTSVFTAY